jgi:hypothetical protein
MKGMMDEFQFLQAGLAGLQGLPTMAGSELLKRLVDGNESLGRFGVPSAGVVKEVSIVYKISKPFAQAADLVCWIHFKPRRSVAPEYVRQIRRRTSGCNSR